MSHHHNHGSGVTLSRRSFLQSLGAVTAGGLPLIGTNAFGQTVNDYKAIICVFLFGGNDGNHWVYPYDAAEYEVYRQGRGPYAGDGGISIRRDQLLQISPANTGTRKFGLHYALPGIKALFDQGKAAIIANSGPLRKPITKAEYQASNANRPTNLFSHSDQQLLWHYATPDLTTLRTGWGGRMGDLMKGNNNAGDILTCVSTNGASTFVTGDQVRAFPVSSGGDFGIDFYDTTNKDKVAMTTGFRRMISSPRARNLFEGEWSNVLQGALRNQQILQQSLAQAQAFAQFPNNGLGNQMETIARLISVRSTLGVKRQIYFCGIGGFDLHGDEHYQRNAELYTEIDQSVSALYATLNSLGLANNVTTFTASDFNRTFGVNGRQGTDHAWGNHHFVIGGSVKGGNVYGRYPNVQRDGPDDVGDGRWIPSVSVDQMSATMAKWFGVTDTQLDTLLPNLKNFPVRDLGFMA
jgi:uncharacterized protein (DUF1501 family)